MTLSKERTFPFDEPQIHMIRPDITPPVLIRRLEPEYPRIARIAHVQGWVILQAVITKQGKVQILSVIRSDNRILDQAAQAAVSQWEYRPAMFNGRPVAVYFQITVKFALK